MKKYDSIEKVYSDIKNHEIKAGDIVEINTPVYPNLIAFKGEYKITLIDGQIRFESTSIPVSINNE